MIILPNYSKYVNEKYGNRYEYGYIPDYGFGDGGYGYVNGDGDYGYVSGDGDIAFEIMPKKYLHNLIIIMN